MLEYVWWGNLSVAAVLTYLGLRLESLVLLDVGIAYAGATLAAFLIGFAYSDYRNR